MDKEDCGDSSGEAATACVDNAAAVDDVTNNTAAAIDTSADGPGDNLTASDSNQQPSDSAPTSCPTRNVIDSERPIDTACTASKSEIDIESSEKAKSPEKSKPDSVCVAGGSRDVGTSGVSRREDCSEDAGQEGGTSSSSGLDPGEDSSSGSGVVRFKKLKLSHRNYRDKSTENLFKREDKEQDKGEQPSSDSEGGPEARREGTSDKGENKGEESDSLDSDDDEVINLQDELSSSSSSTIEFDVDDRGPEDRVGGRRVLNLGMDTSDSDEDDDERPARLFGYGRERGVQEDGQIEEQATSESNLILDRPQPKPHFNIASYFEIHREVSAKRRRLQNRFYSSIPVVQRLNVNYKLEGHEGCVNSLHFNQSGDKIASGSDDLMIIVWDWKHKNKLTTFPTGHRENVFQSKFLPGDLLITSCSRDGQVRLAELCPAGSLRSTRKLAQHRSAVHKLALVEDNYVVLSAGEDAQILTVDTREQRSDKLLLLKNDKDKRIPIYSIHTNPANQNQFCTAGREHFIRVFDRRFVSASDPREVVKFCPSGLRGSDNVRAYITCAVFSHHGREVLGSYSDEDIYMFEMSGGEGAEHCKQFRGHRNSATVKAVNFFGPRSEYVISGSDCGNVFFWSKETESIVNISKGDENGVVNVLEPHPTMPILATSGLDEEVKIWYPNKSILDDENCEEKTRESMRKTVKKNLMKKLDKSEDADSIYGHLLYQLFHNLRRVEQRRMAGQEAGRQGEGAPEGEGDTSDEDEGPRRHQCAQS